MIPWFIIEDEIEPPRLTVRDVQRAVCQHYGITRDTLLARRRNPQYVFPRHVAQFLAKTLTRATFPAIGRVFDNMDHTTVLHACRRIDALRQRDPELQSTLDAISERLDTLRYGRFYHAANQNSRQIARAN